MLKGSPATATPGLLTPTTRGALSPSSEEGRNGASGLVCRVTRGSLRKARVEGPRVEVTCLGGPWGWESRGGAGSLAQRHPEGLQPPRGDKESRRLFQTKRLQSDRWALSPVRVPREKAGVVLRCQPRAVRWEQPKCRSEVSGSSGPLRVCVDTEATSRFPA